MKLKFSAVYLIIHLLLLVPSTIYSISVPDRPTAYVMDLAGVINDNVEVNLNRYLRELEEKTSSQMVVLSIDSLEGESIEDIQDRGRLRP
jgi:uncharacterized protein